MHIILFYIQFIVETRGRPAGSLRSKAIFGFFFRPFILKSPGRASNGPKGRLALLFLKARAGL